MKIIAHRCGNDKFPELTIDSAKHSLKCGAYLVEMDVHFTSDNIPVISHDSDCKFLFGNNRKIRDMTIDDFLQLSYIDNSGYKALCLEDIMKAKIKNILLHIKVGGEKLNIILDLCRKYRIENEVVLGIASIDDLKRVKNYNSEIKTLAFLYDLEKIHQYAEEGVDYIRLWEHWLTTENINAVKSTGKKLWIMSGHFETVGYPDYNIDYWNDLDADAVLVNNVEDYI